MKIFGLVHTLLSKLLFPAIGLVFKLFFGLLRLAWRAARGPDPDMEPFHARGRAVDGDSLVFAETRVRLFGVDAPELKQHGGPEAHAHLCRLIKGKTLSVRPVDRDVYGRVVAEVQLPDGTDLAGRMVSDGYATTLRHFTTRYDMELFRAKSAGAGLWATATGITDPGRFRAQGY